MDVFTRAHGKIDHIGNLAKEAVEEQLRAGNTVVLCLKADYDKLEQQLAAANARIVDLERENENKHRVDDLLIETNRKLRRAQEKYDRLLAIVHAAYNQLSRLITSDGSNLNNSAAAFCMDIEEAGLAPPEEDG